MRAWIYLPTLVKPNSWAEYSFSRVELTGYCRPLLSLLLQRTKWAEATTTRTIGCSGFILITSHSISLAYSILRVELSSKWRIKLPTLTGTSVVARTQETPPWQGCRDNQQTRGIFCIPPGAALAMSATNHILELFLEDFSLSATSIRYFFGWRTLIENRTIVRKIEAFIFSLLLSLLELSLVTAENIIKKLLLKINCNPYDILSLYVHNFILFI